MRARKNVGSGRPPRPPNQPALVPVEEDELVAWRRAAARRRSAAAPVDARWCCCAPDVGRPPPGSPAAAALLKGQQISVRASPTNPPAFPSPLPVPPTPPPSTPPFTSPCPPPSRRASCLSSRRPTRAWCVPPLPPRPSVPTRLELTGPVPRPHSQTGKPTGIWATEHIHAYYVLKDSFKLTVASPKGGVAPIDPGSVEFAKGDEGLTRFQADAEAQRVLNETVKLADVKAEDYDAVFYPGGCVSPRALCCCYCCCCGCGCPPAPRELTSSPAPRTPSSVQPRPRRRPRVRRGLVQADQRLLGGGQADDGRLPRAGRLCQRQAAVRRGLHQGQDVHRLHRRGGGAGRRGGDDPVPARD